MSLKGIFISSTSIWGDLKTVIDEHDTVHCSIGDETRAVSIHRSCECGLGEGPRRVRGSYPPRVVRGLTLIAKQISQEIGPSQ
jgi:hypothetical protein